MYQYQVEVKFDDAHCSVQQSETYFRVAGIYNASCMGHDRIRTSTMFFSSDKRLTKKDLAKQLEDMPIIRFTRREIRATA